MSGGCLQATRSSYTRAQQQQLRPARAQQQLRRQATACRQNDTGSKRTSSVLLGQKARRAAVATSAASGNGAGSGGEGGGNGSGGGGGGGGKQATFTTEKFKQQMQLLGTLLVRCAKMLVASPAGQQLYACKTVGLPHPPP